MKFASSNAILENSDIFICKHLFKLFWLDVDATLSSYFKNEIYTIRDITISLQINFNMNLEKRAIFIDLHHWFFLLIYWQGSYWDDEINAVPQAVRANNVDYCCWLGLLLNKLYPSLELFQVIQKSFHISA